MLSHMHEVLGTRYCEPTAMKVIMTRAMQLIMKGTFNRADLAGRGRTGTRWQMLDEQFESCSAEDVGKLQDARGAPSGPASSMISTPRQRQAARLRLRPRRLRLRPRRLRLRYAAAAALYGNRTPLILGEDVLSRSYRLLALR